MTTSRRLADRKIVKFDKNITKRGSVPETTTKKGKDYPVGPILLGFFVFVVIGSFCGFKYSPGLCMRVEFWRGNGRLHSHVTNVCYRSQFFSFPPSPSKNQLANRLFSSISDNQDSNEWRLCIVGALIVWTFSSIAL
ncbi:hypothetical protein Lal_00012768 [Lupinus albus]|nr:hypothetical protein Lal_00012768 [Lupinus albus]